MLTNWNDGGPEQEHMELEKRYRELTDLLVRQFWNISVSVMNVLLTNDLSWQKHDMMHDQYYKQTQLEAMTSEKAAAEFHLEKEMNRIKEAQVHYWLVYASIKMMLVI